MVDTHTACATFIFLLQLCLVVYPLWHLFFYIYLCSHAILCWKEINHLSQLKHQFYESDNFFSIIFLILSSLKEANWTLFVCCSREHLARVIYAFGRINKLIQSLLAKFHQIWSVITIGTKILFASTHTPAHKTAWDLGVTNWYMAKMQLWQSYTRVKKKVWY
jgi:hypothetical protein